ncbi:MAG: cysteine desulfurase family protein [Smithellaceae bacterium]|nr:cysteine desulfurase family protein [Smithellaceae bacterium]
MEPIYLDCAATTPADPEVMGAMMRYFGYHFGNPSSGHAFGRSAKEAIERARAQVAALIGADNSEIVFTGGGTEADNLAVLGTALAAPSGRNHIITSTIEHPAVLSTCRFLGAKGFSLTCLPVDAQGTVDPDDVRKAITDRTCLVSIMHANNEIGTIEPIGAIAAIATEKEIAFHTDAVQSVGKIPLDVRETPVALLSLAGHKIYGPKGTGALFIRSGVDLAPITYGGHQEKGIRNGTENVPGIVGLGKAGEIGLRDMASFMDQTGALRDLLEDKIMAAFPDCRVNGNRESRLPHILSVSFPKLSGAAIVAELDKLDIGCSAGSACTAGATHVSHVLEAMAIPPEFALGTIRFSLGKFNTEEEIGRTISAVAEVVGKLKTA